MYALSAFGLIPAAIISDANVWRHSRSPIGVRPARVQAAFARLRTFEGVNGCVGVFPKTSPEWRPGAGLVLDETVSKDGRDRNRSVRGPGLRRHDALLCVPRPLDTDHARRKVDVVPPESQKLAK